MGSVSSTAMIYFDFHCGASWWMRRTTAEYIRAFLAPNCTTTRAPTCTCPLYSCGTLYV